MICNNLCNMNLSNIVLNGSVISPKYNNFQALEHDESQIINETQKFFEEMGCKRNISFASSNQGSIVQPSYPHNGFQRKK